MAYQRWRALDCVSKNVVLCPAFQFQSNRVRNCLIEPATKNRTSDKGIANTDSPAAPLVAAPGTKIFLGENVEVTRH